MSLSSIFDLLLNFAGIDIAAQISAFQDTFSYSIVLWLLNLGGVI